MEKIKDFIYYNRKEIIIVTILCLVFISYLFIEKKESNPVVVTSEIINETKEDNREIVIDIKGAIKNPGTYKLNLGYRIVDVIEKAGGLIENADTSEINLSEKIYDEMLIYIPFKNDNKEIINNDNKIENKNTSISNGKVSINNASLQELMTIKGIGETKAKNIIEYRIKNGKFKSINEITNVSGIGNSTFEKIKDYIKL